MSLNDETLLTSAVSFSFPNLILALSRSLSVYTVYWTSHNLCQPRLPPNCHVYTQPILAPSPTVETRFLHYMSCPHDGFYGKCNPPTAMLCNWSVQSGSYFSVWKAIKSTYPIIPEMPRLQCQPITALALEVWIHATLSGDWMSRGEV